MLFEDVLERLESEGVRYVVVGGFALALHGFDRPVVELDLVVDVSGAEVELQPVPYSLLDDI